MMSRAPDPMCASLLFPHLDLTSVHVWFCELPHGADVQESFAALLSDEERTRAARFAFERDRQRFVLSHGVLRQLLARYTHIKAGDSVHHWPVWKTGSRRSIRPVREHSV